ncbi:MAG: hypothetical protein Kow00124_08350 [Anaerolineae bacterium]
MLKKIVIGLLSATVVGSAGAAVAYQAAQPNIAEAPQSEVAAAEEITLQSSSTQGGYGNGAQRQAGVQQQVVAAQDMVGIPWTGAGVIASFDDFGFTLALDGGLAIYVELGPPAFWQAQGITLAAGQSVTVEGFTSDGMYHAAVVTFADGSQLVVRDVQTGQPLWSGGATNGSGNGNNNAAANGLQDGSHTPQPQASVDEWVTLEGTIAAINRSSITMTLADGTSLTFQAGQPSFFASQGVTLQVGDAISVLGFYQNEQFMAGEIVQTATGLRVMLRDPNGRPLWAGPGGSGNGGNGNGYGGGR